MTNDEKEIRQLINNWLSASATGDTERVLSLMADDVVFLGTGRPPIIGKAGFAAIQPPLGKFHLEANSDIQEIRILHDWAYCWTKLTVVITPVDGGPPVKRSGDTLSILHKLPDGGWILFRDANMLAVEPPPAPTA